MQNLAILLISIFISGQCFADAKTETVIVALGDSLTEGLGVSPQAAYPTLLEAKLKGAGKNVKVVNAGVSGSTSASGPSRMRFILKSKPTWVIIALGANDGLRGLEPALMRKNLEQTIQTAKAGGAKVLVAGMKAPPNLGSEYAKKFESVFKEIAKDKTIVFVPFLLETVAGEKKYNQPDGIHPNEEGHKIMADLIFKALEKKL